MLPDFITKTTLFTIQGCVGHLKTCQISGGGDVRRGVSLLAEGIVVLRTVNGSVEVKVLYAQSAVLRGYCEQRSRKSCCFQQCTGFYVYISAQCNKNSCETTSQK